MSQKKHFIGDKEVTGFAEIAKSPLGLPIIEVRFDDGTTKRMTEKMYKCMLTDDKTDASMLRELRVNPLVAEILALMAEANITMGETNYVLDKVIMSLNENSSQAIGKILGVNHPDERSMLLIDSILKGNGLTDY